MRILFILLLLCCYCCSIVASVGGKQQLSLEERRGGDENNNTHLSLSSFRHEFDGSQSLIPQSFALIDRQDKIRRLGTLQVNELSFS